MVAALALEEIRGKFGQLAGTEQRGAIHQHRGLHFEVPVLPDVYIQHEAGQRPFQAGTQAPVDGKARARDLRCPLKVENSQPLAQLPMRPGRKIKFGLLPPAHHLDVFRFALPRRNAVLGQVGKSSQQGTHGLFRACRAALALLRLLLQRACLVHQLLNVGLLFACFAAACYLLAQLVPLRLQRLCLGDVGTTVQVELAKIAQQSGRIDPPRPQLRFHQFQVGPHKIQIEHKTLL